MKKEGIMRINSYNKFFAEVAKIMNTSVKAVKQLDCRYTVELANHVYLNVYRGICGSLFIHDHRGIAHITSCYDFEDFKTMNDLYKRLVTDYSESDTTPSEEDCIENAECARGNDVFEGCKTVKNQYFDTDSLQPNKTIIAKIENINCCPNRNTCCIASPFMHCDYNYKSDSCIKAHDDFSHECKKLYNQIKAIQNPNWHHVSLKTLANIDNDMLDEKRRLYFALYRELKKNISNARKCKTIVTFDRSTASFRQKILKMYCNNEITALLYQYFLLQLSMLNVEYGAYDSSMELATGLHESRRYNKIYCN